jgi:hypothetical protein
LRLPFSADLIGMTVNSIASSLAVAQLASGMASRSQTADVSGVPQDGPPAISKLGNYMKQLQDLLQTDPEKFKEVTAQIASKLEEAAKTATENGDTKSAEMLTGLADQFQQASDNLTMPDLRPPEDASAAGTVHHGPPPGPPPSDSSTDEDSDSTTTSTLDSTSNSSDAVAKYKELLKLLEQSADSNPMATLENVLTDVFKSVS